MSTPRYYRRRPTRAVSVGQVGIGGKNPIRVQSMTTSDTKDTTNLIAEMHRLVEAGCEIIRVTVPTQADCDNLPNIRKIMKREGLKTPLVADIHFTPTIALKCVEYVEKIRINPGNFADKKLFKKFEITEDEYKSELTRIEEKFVPLVKRCQELGVAMRIGTNHGSLSDRIMNRYGDTPRGMVESAMEFVRIASQLGYHDLILSMKASNTQVMITAYRELAKTLAQENFHYPFHLGVTEAGEGEDGRVKSAIGIGTLLEEGIGDTIRVSLTEDSQHEIPVAAQLVAPYNSLSARENFLIEMNRAETVPEDLREVLVTRGATSTRRLTPVFGVGPFTHGASEPVRVWSSGKNLNANLAALKGDLRFEGIECALDSESLARLGDLQNTSIALISDDATALARYKNQAHKFVLLVRDLEKSAQLISPLQQAEIIQEKNLEICLDTSSVDLSAPDFGKTLAAFLNYVVSGSPVPSLGLSLKSANPLHDYRLLANSLIHLPFTPHLHLRYEEKNIPASIDAAIQLGGLLVDGLGDSIQLDAASLTDEERQSLAYNILQGSRVRISRTEFISCPSCGRTQFDLQKTTERIRSRTSHLKGVKIAIMGCIVNGPGEMADADFGYVGTGVKRVSLYVGHECLEKNLPEEVADERLIELIKQNGRWVDPT